MRKNDFFEIGDGMLEAFIERPRFLSVPRLRDMTTDRNPALLESNLRFLRARSPEYADVLSAIRESPDYTFWQAGPAIGCRDREGAWEHGPDDPWDAARSTATDVSAETAELLIVVRPGLGYVPLAVLEALAKKNPGSVLLVVEDRLELLKAAFARIDWAPLLTPTCAVLLLGDPNVVVEAFLERHPALSLLPMTIFADPGAAAALGCQELADRLVTRSEEVRESTEKRLGAADALLRQRRSRKEPPHVVLAGSELGYLARPLVEGFRSLGCRVQVQAPNPRVPKQILAHEWMSHVVDLLPDLVLWVNRPEVSRLGSDMLRALGVAQLLWFVDSPRRLFRHGAEVNNMDLVLSFDERYLEGIGRDGARVAQFSVGAGLEPLPGCTPADIRWPERRGPEISFVGTCGPLRVRELRERLRLYDPRLPGILDELAELPGDPAEAFTSRCEMPYEGGPCLYVDEVRSTRRRYDVLSALTGFELSIFGDAAWSESSLAAWYTGRGLEYGPDLASAYFHSSVNVNIFHDQCVDSTNSRVYDVLASGGFLLTEDRPCLARQFEIGHHLVTFSTPEEALEKVRYYLAHPAERDAIARAGQMHVLRHHTFRERCQRLLELGGPYVRINGEVADAAAE